MSATRAVIAVACACAIGATSPSTAEPAAAKASTLTTLDIDGNGTVDSLTDGLLLMRYMFGVRGADLIRSAIGAGAIRTTAAQIERYIADLDAFQLPLVPPSECSIDANPPSSPDAYLESGTPVALTVSCARGTPPLTAAWYLGVLSAGPVTVAPNFTTTYVAKPGNATGWAPPVSTTVYTGPHSPNGAPPADCSIAQSPDTLIAPVAPSTTVTLTLTCASGGPVTSCGWSNGIGALTCNVNVAFVASSSVQVSAVNAAGASPAVSTTVHVNP